jgi:hypothetical protein
MSTPKQLLAKLLKTRPAMDNTVQVSTEARKVVYIHFTEKIVALRNEFQKEDNLLAQAMEDAHTAQGDGLYPDGIAHDSSACTVSFTSKSAAKKAAQFLADIYGFWRNNREGTERIDDYRLRDKTMRCTLESACSFFDPNGFMDFHFTDLPLGAVVTIDRDQHQFAKRYLDAFSQVQDHGIVPDWPYAKGDCERIWKTHQLKVKLTQLIVSSCQTKKPHPEITLPSHTITFQDDEGGVDILVDGTAPKKFNSTARRAVLALSLQPDLAAINTKNFCNDFDPVWGKTKFGLKNVPKKFAQAMQSLRRVVHGLHDELLGDSKARVVGIKFENKPSNAKLKQQIGNLLKPQPD